MYLSESTLSPPAYSGSAGKKNGAGVSVRIQNYHFGSSGLGLSPGDFALVAMSKASGESDADGRESTIVIPEGWCTCQTGDLLPTCEVCTQKCHATDRYANNGQQVKWRTSRPKPCPACEMKVAKGAECLKCWDTRRVMGNELDEGLDKDEIILKRTDDPSFDERFVEVRTQKCNGEYKAKAKTQAIVAEGREKFREK